MLFSTFQAHECQFCVVEMRWQPLAVVVVVCSRDNKVGKNRINRTRGFLIPACLEGVLVALRAWVTDVSLLSIRETSFGCTQLGVSNVSLHSARSDWLSCTSFRDKVAFVRFRNSLENWEFDFFIAWAKAWPNFPGGNLGSLAQIISPSLLEFNNSSGFNHHGDDAYAQCSASTWQPPQT